MNEILSFIEVSLEHSFDLPPFTSFPTAFCHIILNPRCFSRRRKFQRSSCSSSSLASDARTSLPLEECLSCSFSSRETQELHCSPNNAVHARLHPRQAMQELYLCPRNAWAAQGAVLELLQAAPVSSSSSVNKPYTSLSLHGLPCLISNLQVVDLGRTPAAKDVHSPAMPPQY